MNIILNGDIGWEITPSRLREELKDKGDVVIELNSYGGIVFDGFECYNILKDHPGNVKIICGSIVASSAGWMLLAADSVSVHKNTSWMAHPVTGGAWGNSSELRKEADVIDGLEKLISDIFKGKNIEVDMTTETWLFGGEEIVKAGIAQDLLDYENEDETLDGENVNKIKANFAITQNRISKFYKDNQDSISEKTNKLLANFEKEIKFNKEKEQPINKGVKMDLAELKNKHPELFAEVKNLGRTEETERVEAWLAFNEISSDDVAKGIASGKAPSMKDISNFAMKSINANKLKNLSSDSSGDVDTRETETETEPKEGELSAEAKELQNLLKNKYGKKVGK